MICLAVWVFAVMLFPVCIHMAFLSSAFLLRLFFPTVCFLLVVVTCNWHEFRLQLHLVSIVRPPYFHSTMYYKPSSVNRQRYGTRIKKMQSQKDASPNVSRRGANQVQTTGPLQVRLSLSHLNTTHKNDKRLGDLLPIRDKIGYFKASSASKPPFFGT